jgi:hypothetical protein
MKGLKIQALAVEIIMNILAYGQANFMTQPNILKSDASFWGFQKLVCTPGKND